jgi:hypothetical protein
VAPGIRAGPRTRTDAIAASGPASGCRRRRSSLFPRLHPGGSAPRDVGIQTSSNFLLVTHQSGPGAVRRHVARDGRFTCWTTSARRASIPETSGISSSRTRMSITSRRPRVAVARGLEACRAAPGRARDAPPIEIVWPSPTTTSRAMRGPGFWRPCPGAPQDPRARAEAEGPARRRSAPVRGGPGTAQRLVRRDHRAHEREDGARARAATVRVRALGFATKVTKTG